jgi:hypothetical protein
MNSAPIGWPRDRDILFSFFFRFSPRHARPKEPVGQGFARNFRTTVDPLKASDGQIASIIGLLDLHASGS